MMISSSSSSSSSSSTIAVARRQAETLRGRPRGGPACAAPRGPRREDMEVW